MVTIKDQRTICANCGARDSIYDPELIGFPFVCEACDWWGETRETIENPPPNPPEDGDYSPTKQVKRKPTH